MKISKVESFFVKPRWHFLKISTDNGLVGWGEPIVEGRARTVAMAVKELEPVLIGQNPLENERLWTEFYRGTFYRGGPVLVSAISGIDQALWDIKGKYFGVPAYELAGGPTRSRVRTYAHVHGRTVDELIENAKASVAKGFTLFKTSPTEGPVRPLDTLEFMDKAIDKIGRLRESLPRHVDLAIDFHGRFTPAMSIRLLRELEQFRLYFVEEPVQVENVDALVTVARSTSIPIATGERLFTRWGFREVLEKQAAVIVQPDLCHAGGITEVRKIAAMAEMYYAQVAPHNPLGPISLAAGLQLCGMIPNCLCQEQASLGVGYLKQPFEIKDGHLDLPDGPGLGIEVDEDYMREMAYPGDWDSPRLYNDDGSFTEW
ncbi:MAG: galactonate dehydratase [Oscillospiraceae bacterium]|jgi:galactonate dehydratase|nr:galactonate dehydratase [Oscillospiraceae bacterium]